MDQQRVCCHRGGAEHGPLRPDPPAPGPPLTGQRAGERNRGISAPHGTCKYSVAVWNGENVWVVDPEVVVGPNE